MGAQAALQHPQTCHAGDWVPQAEPKLVVSQGTAWPSDCTAVGWAGRPCIPPGSPQQEPCCREHPAL